jgi:hypothetical protein
MTTDLPKKHNAEEFESTIKVARGIALSLAAISIALAALCLALLTFTSTQNRPNDIFFSRGVPITLIILGTFFVLASALIIDWVVNQFHDDDWKTILSKDISPQRFDQFSVRLNLFNSGYFLMCQSERTTWSPGNMNWL